MPQENVDRRQILRIEKCVTPQQPLIANLEDAPADEAPPLSNGHDERSRIRTIEISPPQIASVPPNEKWIGRPDAVEEAIELLARIAHQLELITTQPAARACDAPDRHLAAPE